MSLKPSTKSNPCPVCEDSAGKCRQGREDSDYWQCMIYADARKGEIVSGYKCIGHTRDNLWGQFRLDNSQEWSEQQRQNWLQENQRRRNEQASENEQRQRRSLSALQRHEQYTRLLSELTLHPDDRADLVRRGFTHQQIELSGFRSIGRYHRLQSQYSELLPGISRGNRLIIADEGYLCPIRNADGLIVACQVRLRTLPTAETKRYRWLSGGGQTLHLYPSGCKPEGELALAVFRPQGKPEGIALAEGTGAKPFLVSQRLNLLTIGAAGGQWPSSPELFKQTLEKAEIEVGTKEIKILPDAGDILNQSVMHRWQRVIALLEEWGWSVVIGWWGQIDKTHPDIDELDDLSVVNFISTEEFLAWAEPAEKSKSVNIKKRLEPCRAPSSKAGQWQDKQEETHYSSSQTPIKQQSSKTPSTESEITQPLTDSILSEASIQKTAESESVNPKRYIQPIQELPFIGFHVIRRSQDELLEIFDALHTKRGQEWLQLRQFTPDITIDSQYFDYDFKPGENLAIRSGLGTGKSYFTNAKWLASSDDGAVLGGYRNCLNEQFCANGEKLNGRPWYQIQADLKNSQDAALISDPQSRIAGAVDSWVYFSSHHFDGKKVIFDEVESVAKHLNQSSTAVSFYREIIKQRVSDALTTSAANLIADGNLRDFTVEYFEKLSGGKKFTKILNTYTGNRGKLYLYNGSSRKRKATEEDVKNGLAIKVDDWISFDHKSDDFSKLHRVMVDLPIDIPLLLLSDSQKKCEAWDRELSTKGRKVFRLDSTTSTSDLGRLFLTDPKSFILSEKIDTVILSPSAESGISIELLDELERKIPGYFKYEFAFFFGVSVTDIQTQFLGRNRDPYTEKFVYVQTHSMPMTRQITDEENSKDIFSTWVETMKDCASLSLQGLEEGEILKIALEKIKAQLLDPHTQYESKLLLKESFEREYPRFCLEYALRESGWEVLVVESRQDDLSDLRAMEQEIAQEKAVAVFSAQEITSTEAEQLARKLNKTPEERNQITKSRLISRLPGIAEKVITLEKTIQGEEQLKQIEESELEKVTKVGDLSYPEWQDSPSKEIPSGGIKVTVEKPAFDPDFVNKVLHRDRAFVSRIEAQFLLRNPQMCKLIQQHKWHKKLDLLTDPDSVSFGGLPVSRYRSKWLEIHTLYEMGIAFFLNPKNSWHDETPQALSFWQQGKIPRNARNIGVKHEDDPCTYIGKVLKKFGLRTQELKQKTRPDGTRYREYSIREIEPLSQAVYECVERKVESQVSEFNFDWKKIVKNSSFKTTEVLASHDLQPAHLQPDNYIEARVEVCSAVVPAETLSPVEEVVPTLPYCQSAEDLMAIAVGYSSQVIEEAIALQSEPLREQLEGWFYGQLAQPELTAGEKLAQSQEVVEENPMDALIKIFDSCQSELDFVEVSKFCEISEGQSPAEKEEFLETAILYSPLPIKHKLQRWWDSAVHEIRDFWCNLEHQELRFSDLPT